MTTITKDEAAGIVAKAAAAGAVAAALPADPGASVGHPMLEILEHLYKGMMQELQAFVDSIEDEPEPHAVRAYQLKTDREYRRRVFIHTLPVLSPITFSAAVKKVCAHLEVDETNQDVWHDVAGALMRGTDEGMLESFVDRNPLDDAQTRWIKRRAHR